ncbi:YciI family protein [Streptosporangium sp. NPDC048865]|uniref:YciI family protein n=1 Tax=Streptosporangium sp. NPDC048865 TaxID=3155766 RepID=UPI0034127FBC
MKYMILAYGSQQFYDSLAGKDGVHPAASAEELAAIGEFLATFTGDLAASGELVDAQGLTAPVLARRIQLRDGVQVVTDGPFAETEEVVAGYWIVDCAGFDRATEIAARLIHAPGRPADAGVVIRPVMGAGDDIDDI